MKWIALEVATLQVGLIWSSALFFGPSALRRIASLGLALLTLGVPTLLPPEEGFWRCFAAVFAILPLFKWVQSVGDQDAAGPRTRLWQWSAVFDVRRTRSTAPRFDGRLAMACAAGLGVGSVGVLIIQRETPAGGLSLVSYAGGLLAVIGMVQGITDGVRLIHLAAGIEVPPIQRQPWFASSVRDFWARRWNRTVHDWLARHIFRPLARRGRPGLGVGATFSVSALVHFYIAWVPAGPVAGATMASFFLAQIPLVLMERWAGRALDGRRGRVFALVGLLGTSPLFIGPIARIIGGPTPV